MTGPRPLPNPEPIAWSSLAITIVTAGIIGAGAAWFLTRRWER